MSSSTKLESLIQQYGWNEIINDLVWLYQLENEKSDDSLPLVPLGHKFKRELEDHFHQVNKLCPHVDWKRDIINHKTQYPIDLSGQLGEVCRNNVDFLISGHSSITGNLIQLKVEKWQTSVPIFLEYNITYYLGKYFNGGYIEKTFNTLEEVVKFIESIDPPSPYTR
jgi:hypothetical protein